MKRAKKATAFLEKHKNLFGFGDWRLFVIDRTSDANEGVIAECEPDHYEKTLTVTLYEEFARRDDWKETLIHELCHGRWGLVQLQYNKSCEKIQYELEEQAVNDITRGVMSLLK